MSKLPLNFVLFCKMTYFLFQENFPCPLQEVAVLKPTGFLQKTFGSLSAGSVKENYKFKVSYISAHLK